ncbi:MAG TPA: glycosyltransferase [Planctomycetaceae bacterium]|nr:glycosyltransferase [Planctomycetaceae bacterium]HQZ67124.1 glycosyltransferase [Planctomycetaceae bacterium]
MTTIIYQLGQSGTERSQIIDDDGFAPEVTVMMPCLNEAETLATCIKEAMDAFQDSGISGEVVIADNGSTDGSQAIAVLLGARVVQVAAKGYGNALMGGIAAASGEYIVMGDSDASYNFGHVPRIVEKLREGYDLVLGNRFLGGIEPGAMPWHHYWIGNPVLSGIGKLFFRCPAGDFHCGLRGFSKAAYEKMNLSTTGMEFASEMVIKSMLNGLKIAEIPTVLRPDGRSRPPHLRSWRDGWRHLRFMLIFCPRWLFVIPGLTLSFVGIALMLLLVSAGTFRVGPTGQIGLSVNTMLAAGAMVLVGYQILLAGTFIRTLGTIMGSHPRNAFLDRWSQRLPMEYGVVAGGILTFVGVILLGHATWYWHSLGYGELPREISVRQVIPSVILTCIGVQTVFGSFFLSVLSYLRRTRVSI